MSEISDRQIYEFFGEYERPSQIGLKYDKKHRRIDDMVKKDCFAYRRARCNVLTEMICKCGECSFYKTVAQDRADREKYRPKTPYRCKGDVL